MQTNTGLLRLLSLDYSHSYLRIHGPYSALFHEMPQRAAQACFISSAMDLNIFSPSSPRVSQSQNSYDANMLSKYSGWERIMEGGMVWS